MLLPTLAGALTSPQTAFLFSLLKIWTNIRVLKIAPCNCNHWSTTLSLMAPEFVQTMMFHTYVWDLEECISLNTPLLWQFFGGFFQLWTTPSFTFLNLIFFRSHARMPSNQVHCCCGRYNFSEKSGWKGGLVLAGLMWSTLAESRDLRGYGKKSGAACLENRKSVRISDACK